MKKIILTGLGLGLLIGVAGTANATMTGFQFSGSWTSVDYPLDSWFGNTFDATVRYDTASTGTQSSGSGGTMVKYTGQFSLTSQLTALDQTANIKIYNDVNGKDQFVVWFNPPSAGNLQFPTGMPTFGNGFLNLTDDNASVFGSDNLPDTLTLASFRYRTLSFWFGDNNDQLVTGQIDTITPLPTPEPGTCLLLATGLAVLVGTHRRKKKIPA